MNAIEQMELDRMAELMVSKAWDRVSASGWGCYVFVYKTSPRARKRFSNAVFAEDDDMFYKWCEEKAFTKCSGWILIGWKRIN